MKYCVLIIDGAAGLPLPERGGKTCLEIARTPNLDAMAKEGFLGLVCTVPAGMEPSSACACMSVLGYDPKFYYMGRAGIEAKSMGIPIDDDEVVFRCNLVATADGKMLDYSSGHIGTEEAVAGMIEALDRDSRLVRRGAVRGLAEAANPAAIGPLIAHLEDPDSKTRKLVFDALVGFGDHAAPTIEAALAETTPQQGRLRGLFIQLLNLVNR